MNIDEKKNGTCHICALTKLTMILADAYLQIWLFLLYSFVLVIILLCHHLTSIHASVVHLLRTSSPYKTNLFPSGD